MREKHYSQLKIYDRLRASEQADSCSSCQNWLDRRHNLNAWRHIVVLCFVVCNQCPKFWTRSRALRSFVIVPWRMFLSCVLCMAIGFKIILLIVVGARLGRLGLDGLFDAFCWVEMARSRRDYVEYHLQISIKGIFHLGIPFILLFKSFCWTLWSF